MLKLFKPKPPQPEGVIARLTAERDQLRTEIAAAEAQATKVAAEIERTEAQFREAWERDRPDHKGQSGAVERLREHNGMLHRKRDMLAGELLRLRNREAALDARASAPDRIAEAQTRVAEARKIAKAATDEAAALAAKAEATRERLAHTRRQAAEQHTAVADAAAGGAEIPPDVSRLAVEVQVLETAVERAGLAAHEARQREQAALAGIGDARNMLRFARCNLATVEAEAVIEAAQEVLARAALAQGLGRITVNFTEGEMEAARAWIEAE